jgi:hypothetical protein
MMVPVAPSLIEASTIGKTEPSVEDGLNRDTVGDDSIMLPPAAENWPAGARSGATSWLREAADEDGDTGRWTSAVSASDGQIWVAYYNAASRDLKAAHWNGWSWSVENVYSFGDVGRYAEIDLDSQNNPRIASFDVTNAVLRISRYDGTSWTTNTVAPGENTGEDNPYAGVGRIGFAIDDSDSEWYSFYVEVLSTSLGYDYNLSFANYDNSDGTWAYGTIDDGQGERSDTDHWSDVGKFSSMVIGSDGDPRVAYSSEIWQGRDELDQSVTRWPFFALRQAAFDGAGWTITNVHVNETGMSYRPAWWVDIDIDSQGYEYIAYQNTSGADSVRLATNAGGSWAHILIDNSSTANYGSYVRIAIDATDEQHISHYDSSNDDLLLSRGSSQTWEHIKVATLGDMGAYADLVIDGNNEEIFTYFDGDNSNLIIATPASDGDGDGLADGQDRCQSTPAGKIIDDSGCHYDQQILTTDSDDFAYVDVIKGADGLLRMANFGGYSTDESSCDSEPTNMTDDCNLVYRKQNGDGTWGAAEIVDQGGNTGRYASIEVAPDGTEHISFHSKTAINPFGFTTQTAVRMASNSGGSWSVEDVAVNNSTGWFTDLAIDSSGNKIVSYTDRSGIYDEMKVARDNSGSWVEQVVQVNATFGSVEYIDDVAHVAYYSSNPDMIRLAVEDGAGGWTIHDVTTTGVVSFYRLELDVTADGNLLIAFARGTDNSGDTICDAPHECTLQVAEWNGIGFNYTILHQGTSASISSPTVAIDSTGLVHAAWYDTDSGALKIASPTKNGHETLTLMDDASGGAYPKILVDENGWESVWYFSTGTTGQLRQIDRFAWEADHDFVTDENDQCPDTPYGAGDIDFYGCSYPQRDDDYDSIPNSDDLCDETPGTERHLADGNGCSPSQKDADGDGVNDAIDDCSGTTDFETVDSYGCSDEQRDSDNDGVNDNVDQCPDTPPGEQPDLNGCGGSQRDNDGDGVNDKDDFMPNDDSQQYDSDGDGLGDNTAGTNGDDCPTEFGTSTVDLQGCPDLDEDGTSNANDDDDDGDGWSDADEIANGTDPLFMLDFPRVDDGGSDGEGTDTGGDGSGDGTSDGSGDQTETSGQGGPSMALIGGIVAVIVLLLAGVAALLLTGGKKEPALGVPSLLDAQTALGTPGAPGSVGGATSAAPAAAATATAGTQDSGQKGEMVATGKPCKHCGAMDVHHIPSYGADYCKSCKEYN